MFSNVYIVIVIDIVKVLWVKFINREKESWLTKEGFLRPMEEQNLNLEFDHVTVGKAPFQVWCSGES